jgi:hypothetical protein
LSTLTLHQALSKGYWDIVFFAESLLGMPLHEGQRRYLRAKAEDFRAGRKIKIWVLVPGNRWGKSVTLAILHIWHCTYKIGLARGDADAIAKASYATANLSPHSETTKPVFDAIKQIMTSAFVIKERNQAAKNNNCLLTWLIDLDHIRNQPPFYIPFTNRSEILFRSTGEDKGDSIQGKSFGYISDDEGGRDKHLEYVMTSNVIPRLGDLGGWFDLVSTPDQKSPSILHHMDLFEKGMRQEQGYYAQEGDASENHYLPEDYVQSMIDLYRGDPILDQVLYGKFVFSGDAFYKGPDIQAAKNEELNGGMAYEAGREYVIAVDTAMGEDEQVYTVLRKPIGEEVKWKLVRQLSVKGNSKSPDVHMADFIALVGQYKRFNNVKIIIEAWNGESGRFCLDLPYDLQVITTPYGSWTFPGRSKLEATNKNPRMLKPNILLALRKMLANGQIEIPNESTLVKQLSIYREDDSNIPTDRVISLALACWLATDGAPKHNNEVIEVNW